MKLPDQIAYYDNHMGDYGILLKELRPTGNWRLRLNMEGNVSMQVEHQGWIFKHWIDESDIYFKYPEITTEVQSCK